MRCVHGNVLTSGGVHRVSFSLSPGAESALCIPPCNRSHEWCASDAATADRGYGHILPRVFRGTFLQSSSAVMHRLSANRNTALSGH